MSLRKKSDHKQTFLMCVLLALVMVIFVYVTDDGSSEPAADSTPEVSVEAPVEKEPTDPTPAIIGGVAAIAAYYLGSVAVSALKKGKQKDEKKEK